MSPTDRPKKSAKQAIKYLLYPEGRKEDTPQMQSPIENSDETSSDEDWASKHQVAKLQGQVKELCKFVYNVVKQHAKDIDSLKTLARMSQRANGTLRDELSEIKFEVAQSLSFLENRLTEVEN